MARTKRIQEKIEVVKEFPKSPGVYLMKNDADKIIYVGKAKSLRSRVRSYLSDNVKGLSPKTRFLVSQIHSIDTILTKTEVEAFLLEASLIKKHRPKYNIRLKDDKAYPYIKLSINDEYPRLYLSRRVRKDGALYFGPYTSGYAVHETIKFLNKTFQLRDCNNTFFKNRQRPCLTHQIGRCTAPCVNLVSPEEYAKDVNAALEFLRGKNQKLLSSLEKRMEEAAKFERFEVAAKIRDSLYAVERILEKQPVVSDSREIDQDAIGFYGDERGTMIGMLHVRQGRILGKKTHLLPQVDLVSDQEDEREWLTSFINQYYDDNKIPDEVLLPVDLGKDIRDLLKQVLKERSGIDVEVRFPTDKEGSHLLQEVDRFTHDQFKDFVSKSQKKMKGLEAIQKRFKLPKLPCRIECYDISTFQGAETVASQVVFEDGVPAKEHYRRYKIRTVSGVDDFASMKEVLSRRLAHTEWDDPDLILVDGGKGQLNIALEVLKELGREEIPAVGIAKSRTKGAFRDTDVQETEERFFLPGRQNPVVFRKGTDAFQILVGLRDEAHRFAITYHRKLRESTTLESELDYVVGLGEKRKMALLKNFPSIAHLRVASPEEISKIKGFNRVLAERILLQLNESEDDLMMEKGENGEQENSK